MAISHIRRVWDLRSLPPTLKLILLALANHASEDNNECWPGYERLANFTGLCTKTVQRSIKSLEKSGLIDVDRGKIYNKYKLHLNGDIEDFNEYLKFYFEDTEDGYKDKPINNKDSMTSETSIGININKTTEKNQSIVSCLQDTISKHPLKPSQLETGVEIAWMKSAEKIYKGKVPFSTKDRWVLERFNEHMNKVNIPAEKVVEIIVSRWPKFIEYYIKHVGHNKIEHMPATHFILDNLETTIRFAYPYLFKD